MSSHNYVYDAVNRRTRATLTDSSAWAYAYNDRDEVVSGKHYWADFLPVPSHVQFEYSYDNIGNRSTSRFGGDSAGANLRQVNYTPNNLNQYSQRTVPGYVHVVGVATATATSVAVNSQAADYRRGEYFCKELAVANSTPQSVAVTASATLGGNTVTTPSTANNVFVPASTESFTLR